MYVVFEGPDGSGKTTLVNSVYNKLKFITEHPIVTTMQPGSTQLGKHIRQLVKYPDSFSTDSPMVIDDLSRQMLYMVDCVNNIKTIVVPALENNCIVLSDRTSYISSIVYSLVENDSNIDSILRLHKILKPPTIDLLFVLNISAENSRKRMNHRKDTLGDYYDSKSSHFHDKTNTIYSNINDYLNVIECDIADVIHIDAMITLEQMTNTVVSAIISKFSI